MTTFLELEAEVLLKNSKIIRIGKMINWEKMRYRFNKIHKKTKDSSNFGQKPYDVISMVKAILLQQWHGLSDPELEEALHVILIICQ